jgi:hypothetical protein
MQRFNNTNKLIALLEWRTQDGLRCTACLPINAAKKPRILGHIIAHHPLSCARHPPRAPLPERPPEFLDFRRTCHGYERQVLDGVIQPRQAATLHDTQPECGVENDRQHLVRFNRTYEQLVDLDKAL